MCFIPRWSSSKIVVHDAWGKTCHKSQFSWQLNPQFHIRRQSGMPTQYSFLYISRLLLEVYSKNRNWFQLLFVSGFRSRFNSFVHITNVSYLLFDCPSSFDSTFVLALTYIPPCSWIWLILRPFYIVKRRQPHDV